MVTPFCWSHAHSSVSVVLYEMMLALVAPCTDPQPHAVFSYSVYDVSIMPYILLDVLLFLR